MRLPVTRQPHANVGLPRSCACSTTILTKRPDVQEGTPELERMHGVRMG